MRSERADILSYRLAELTVKHVVTQPAETDVDITCDVCGQSTRVEGYGQQFGTLQAHWGYGSKQDGERYEVHLCESCFFSTLSHLRRERMVNPLFDEQPGTTEDNFGLVRVTSSGATADVIASMRPLWSACPFQGMR